MGKTWIMTAVVVLFIGMAGNIALADGNPSRGKKLFANCADCHAIKRGAPHKVGPSLFGVVGRKLGAAPGFDYPPSHLVAGRNGYVWTEQSLVEYLKNPNRFIRLAGGVDESKSLMLHMILRLQDAQDRKDIVAFLKRYK